MTARLRGRGGLVAIVLVLALVAAGCSKLGAPEGYVVKARFPRTFNLFPGSPVTVLGIRAGVVANLIVEEGSDVVIAELVVQPDVKLPADVNAVVLTSAILGERYVQLFPAYEGGPTFEPGGVIEEPGRVPTEFDELLRALRDFIEGIKDGDLPRLVENLAEVLEGNGEDLGETLEATRDALDVLRDYDEDIIRLATKLSGINETLNTRRRQLTEVVVDFAELSQVLADQRVPLDRALSSLAQLADETGRLLDANRTLIQQDIATLTRVGQTAVRNLDQISTLLLGSAELFRHAERVIDRTHNWLPLVNNTDDLVNYTLDTIQVRLGELCAREGLPTDVCNELTSLLDGIVPDAICLPPLLACGPEGQEAAPAPLDEVVTDTLTQGADDIGDTPEEQQQVQDLVDEVVGNLLGTPDDANADSSADGSSGLLDGALGGGS